MSGDAQPTLPLHDPAAWGSPPPSPKRRRRLLPWIITLVIVVVLAVAAWFIGEAVARELVVKTVRQQVITNLSLPADQQVDVAVEGTVLPQLIAGRLDELRIATDDVAIGGLSGAVDVTLRGVPIRGDGAMNGGTGTVRLDAAQVQALLDSVDGFPDAAIGLSAPDVTVATELSIYGITFPVGIALTPSAVDGDVVLTPAALQVAGATVDAETIVDRFGPLAQTVVRDWDVCIAEYLPAGIRLSSVEVSGDELVAGVDIDHAILSDPAMQANGSCA